MLDPITPTAKLLVKLNAAIAAANEAEKTVTAAQTELVSRSKAVGSLLLEAKKLHPAVNDFAAFLRRVDGLKLSRAYDLMRLAGGRTTDDELKKDARERQKKSRAKKIPLRPEPKKPEAEPDDSVTVTESNAEKPKPEKAANESARALAEFTFACRTYLSKMTETDQHKALQLVTDLVNPKAEAA